MVYFKNDNLCIREMERADIQPLVDAELAMGWHPTVEGFEKRLVDKEEKDATTIVALWNNTPVGYISVYPNSKWGAFANQGLPELVDFAVLEGYRRRGIGTALMTIAETIAAGYSNIVYLGVGLHSGYGAAQRMYVKRGYIPDGSGVWYKDRVCDQYVDCKNDDDLVLYLSKKLRMNQ